MQVDLGLPVALLQIVAYEQQGGDFVCAVGELGLLLFCWAAMLLCSFTALACGSPMGEASS